jgi:hypothetical protein
VFASRGVRQTTLAEAAWQVWRLLPAAEDWLQPPAGRNWGRLVHRRLGALLRRRLPRARRKQHARRLAVQDEMATYL